MAFPTTITSNINAYHGIGGPYVNSAGTAVYIFGRYNAAPEQVQCFKATDPSSAWVAVGVNPSVTSGNPIRQLAVYQYGDSIHVVTRDAAAANSNQLRYHLFNMATDTWELTNELIKTTYTMAGAVDSSIVTIVARSAGAKFVMYEGPQVLADIQRSRVYFARNLGTGWSADFTLGGSGNAHWFPQECILGLSNRIHFFFSDYTNEDLYQRTLDSANTLEALPAAFDTVTVNQDDLMVQRGVAYSGSAGGTIVRAVYLNSYTPDINEVRFSSADVPSPYTIVTDITNPTAPTGGLFRRNMSLAVDVNTTYSTFTNNVGDIYVASSQDAGSWSTPALYQTGATATEVYTNIFTRGGSRKLAICWTRDNTDLKYTEYTLNIAPSVMTDRPDHFNFITAGGTSLRYDNAAYTATNTARNTMGMLLTATSNAVLLVWVATGGGDDSISTVAIGATNLTRLAYAGWPSDNTRSVELWGLTAPPTGILTISAVVADDALGSIAMAGITYTGHKTTGNPFGGVVIGSASGTASTSLIISAAVGNLALFGFTYDFTPGVATVGPGLTQRLLTTSSEWPDLLIAEASGAVNVTGSAFAASTTNWGGIGINLIQSGGDTLKVIVSGRMSATDVVDKLSISGIVASVVHIGSVSATAAPDRFSASGQVIVSGRLSATGATDLFSATGTVVPVANVLGRLSATGAADRLSASGYTIVRGRLSATEGYTDTFAISATTITPVHGSVAWTMRQDTVVINPRQPAGLTPGTLSNAGGGAGRSNKENVPFPIDLWDAREAYLLSLYPEGPHPAPELEDNAKAWQEYEDRKQQLVDLTAERAHAILELRMSPDVATMKACGAHIKELTAKIATLTGKQDFARFMRH